MADGDPFYCYPPDFRVLRNLQDIRDPSALDQFERQAAALRVRSGVPSGKFDLAHLKAIHGHLFQDVYPWAGQMRTCELAKGGTQFLPVSRIETAMDYTHKQLVEAKYLRGRTPGYFAEGAAQFIGDVNYIHPFREGNGRTQSVLLAQLAQQAGHALDLTKIDRDAWLEASIESVGQKPEKLAACISGALAPKPPAQGRSRSRTKGRER